MLESRPLRESFFYYRFSLTDAGTLLAQRLHTSDQELNNCDQVPFTILDPPARSSPRLPVQCDDGMAGILHHRLTLPGMIGVNDEEMAEIPNYRNNTDNTASSVCNESR